MDTIEHLGVVESVKDKHVFVRIVQTSACSTCVAKAHCNASESKEKLIDVYVVEPTDYRIGETVKLVGTTSMGMRAVMWSFGVPFLILFAVLLVLKEVFSFDDLNAGVCCLLSLIPYYGILYLLRDKFSKKFSFIIKPINN